ncbi:MAG: PAS domain-containing protein [Deltaproteobacteria bacterium]|nr:PAS domain-containing protein [Deltaproteobacteria bacterium]
MPDPTPVGTPRKVSAETVFDAIPFPALVVDRDVRVLEYNRSAAEMLGSGKKLRYRKPAGELLHCVHAESTPKGCGYSKFCPDCLLRNTVNEAVADGKVHRNRARLERIADGRTETVVLLLSVSPFSQGSRRRYLVLFEESSEISLLERILPICSHCKRIRDEKNYWKNVEEYFLSHSNLMFSHSLCDACVKELYPSMGR